MESLIALAVVSGATMFSVGVALLLESLLLRVILGCVAKATLAEKAATVEVSFRELRRSAKSSPTVSNLG